LNREELTGLRRLLADYGEARRELGPPRADVRDTVVALVPERAR